MALLTLLTAIFLIVFNFRKISGFFTQNKILWLLAAVITIPLIALVKDFTVLTLVIFLIITVGVIYFAYKFIAQKTISVYRYKKALHTPIQLKELASAKTITPELGMLLATHPDPEVRLILANNPNAPKGALSILACDNLGVIVNATAGNTSTFSDVLNMIADQQTHDAHIMTTVVSNPSTPLVTLHNLVGKDYVAAINLTNATPLDTLTAYTVAKIQNRDESLSTVPARVIAVASLENLGETK